MEFAYIKKLKPFIILAMILIFMPIVTKSGGLVPTDFNGFAVTSDDIIVVGDNTSVTGWKDNKKVFSFQLSFKSDYALSVNQDDNIVIYTPNAGFVFAQDGTPLTLSERTNESYAELKNRKVVTTNDGASYVLTNKLGFINRIIKVENGKQTTVYKTPSVVIFTELAFWEGNLILITCSIAGVLDVRKRRFLTKPTKNSDNYGLTEKTDENETIKEKIEVPKFLKAFSKPEISNKGAAFSSEYSTKPGEYKRIAKPVENTENENETIENNKAETTESQ